MRLFKIFPLSNFQVYSGSHHGVLHIPRTDLFYNWKFVPFDPCIHFAYPHPHLWQPPICSPTSLGGFCFSRESSLNPQDPGKAISFPDVSEPDQLGLSPICHFQLWELSMLLNLLLRLRFLICKVGAILVLTFW